MLQFKYQAKNSRGEIVHGTLRAESEGDAYQELSRQGFFPMAIEVFRDRDSQSKEKKSFFKLPQSWLSKRVSPRELASFFDHFAILLTSGFPVLRCLELIKRQTKNIVLQNALDQISKDIQGGMKLSESLANFPTIFPSTVPGAVQAGEASGKLDEVFLALTKTFEAEAELRSKVTATLVYPAFVTVFGIFTVFFVMTFIVPKLMVFFETWEHPLPLPTKILLGISILFKKGLGALLFILMAVGFFYWRKATRETKMSLIMRSFGSIGFIKSILFLSDFVPMTRTWSLLLKSGVPILESIRITETVVADPNLRKSLRQISAKVAQGSTLSECLYEAQIFPELAITFISVGEESGSLDVAFGRVAQYYERELDQKLKVITTLLEPILILVVGLGICFIVLSLLLPIFEINLMAQ
jgi:type II secretory pathway component PulF